MKKLFYICEADSGGIMEYAIRQSAALTEAGVEVYFLCKTTFPKERLGEGIRASEFGKSRESRGEGRGPLGKIFRAWRMVADLRSEARQVAGLAEELASSPKSQLTTEDTESTENRCVQKQGGAWASHAGVSESDSLASELAGLPVSKSLNRSASGPAFSLDARRSPLDSKAAATRHPLLVTRHNLGKAEVAVLFACYKEYFAPFWVWSLQRLAKKGIVIGTIAHDPVRDFVVGPVWWHRWSVRLGYSFVRDVFVHDGTPVDFAGRQPAGIRVHQIPHGPYEVAKPKIGREAMRWRLGFDSGLTTEFTIEHRGRCEKEQPQVGPKGERAGALESKSTEDQLVQKQGCSPARQDSAVFSNPSSSEFARNSEITSPTSSAVGPDSSSDTSQSLPATASLCDATPSTPASPDIVFLAFGQIRDGKNLDLFLRAMTRLPENVKLLVAGKGDSGSSRQPEFYQKLAEELGVGDRCRWDIRRIPDEEVGDIFAACDVVLVTYSAKFRSASGVLNAAVSARKPVLASAGAGPLKSVVEKYHLGVFVKPDDLEEIMKGASKFVPNSATEQPATRYQSIATLSPAWERYEKENSWEENARRVLKTLCEQ
jgi:glycosyltransferase involved in cell wall biosynthesis